MKGRLQDPVGAKEIEYSNTTGVTVTGGSVLDLGSLGFGIVVNDTLNGLVGMAYVAGRFQIGKTAGEAYAQGQTLYWDSVNKVVTSVQGSKAFGAAHKAALAGDTTAEVNLNERPEEVIMRVVGDASGGGLTIDTGFGVAPAHYMIQSWTAAFAPRTYTSVTPSGGGNAGKLVVVTTAGAGTDIHYLRARKF